MNAIFRALLCWLAAIACLYLTWFTLFEIRQLEQMDWWIPPTIVLIGTVGTLFCVGATVLGFFQLTDLLPDDEEEEKR